MIKKIIIGIVCLLILAFVVFYAIGWFSLKDSNLSAAVLNSVQTGSQKSNSKMSYDQAVKEVNKIYANCLGRIPDSGGLKTYTDLLVSGKQTVGKVSDIVCGSTEALSYKNKLSPVVLNSTDKNTSNLTQITAIYWECLGRSPDQSGLKNYLSQALSGASIDSIKKNICNSPEAKTYQATFTQESKDDRVSCSAVKSNADVLINKKSTVIINPVDVGNLNKLLIDCGLQSYISPIAPLIKTSTSKEIIGYSTGLLGITATSVTIKDVLFGGINRVFGW